MTRVDKSPPIFPKPSGPRPPAPTPPHPEKMRTEALVAIGNLVDGILDITNRKPFERATPAQERAAIRFLAENIASYANDPEGRSA